MNKALFLLLLVANLTHAWVADSVTKFGVTFYFHEAESGDCDCIGGDLIGMVFSSFPKAQIS